MFLLILQDLMRVSLNTYYVLDLLFKSSESDLLLKAAMHMAKSKLCLYLTSGWNKPSIAKYQLPHPLHLLDYPPTKEAFKRLVNAKVLDFWERKLRLEASFLPSLAHFKPEFHSLLTDFGPLQERNHMRWQKQEFSYSSFAPNILVGQGQDTGQLNLLATVHSNHVLREAL